MARVLGVGTGLFLLAVIIVLALFLCVAFTKAGGALKNAAVGIVALAVITSVILIVLPRQPESAADQQVTVITDDMVIPRTVLLSFMVIFTLLSLAFLVVFDYVEPIYAKPIRTR
ncbi:transmembrane protein 218-like [Branchiostoma lanceolatum]|uniref:transmembrane protein 218-like n=1 Tax=Branchiostoma lanceolatum TaxID=7740 RepID=UPI00113319BC